MKPSDRYPGIARAALEIEYDNGGINRDRTEAQYLMILDAWLLEKPQSEFALNDIDAFFSALPLAKLQTICAGELSEADALLASAPAETRTLLDRIFEEVG